MSNEPDLLARADLLIRPDVSPTVCETTEPRRLSRRRSFVAASEAPRQQQQGELSLDQDDDLPVLTDVVTPPTPMTTDETADLGGELRDTLANDLADCVRRRLVDELPAQVDDFFRRASDELRACIATTLTDTIGDFLAQRGQLRLPLTLTASDNPVSSRETTTSEIGDDSAACGPSH